MGVVAYTDEHTSSVSPARIFKASVVDSHNLMPKILPDAIEAIEFIKSDGGAGSIKQINFAGGCASDKIEKVSSDIKFEGSPDGGTISKMTTTIYTHGDFEIKEEKLKAGKEKVLGLYTVVEVCLLKNPYAYA